jgi:hypothetical protein
MLLRVYEQRLLERRLADFVVGRRHLLNDVSSASCWGTSTIRNSPCCVANPYIVGFQANAWLRLLFESPLSIRIGRLDPGAQCAIRSTPSEERDQISPFDQAS